MLQQVLKGCQSCLEAVRLHASRKPLQDDRPQVLHQALPAAPGIQSDSQVLAAQGLQNGSAASKSEPQQTPLVNVHDAEGYAQSMAASTPQPETSENALPADTQASAFGDAASLSDAHSHQPAGSMSDNQPAAMGNLGLAALAKAPAHQRKETCSGQILQQPHRDAGSPQHRFASNASVYLEGMISVVCENVERLKQLF